MQTCCWLPLIDRDAVLGHFFEAPKVQRIGIAICPCPALPCPALRKSSNRRCRQKKFNQTVNNFLMHNRISQLIA